MPVSNSAQGSQVYAVILAGGSGTRFWPASRRARPKQFLAISPNKEESLLRATVRRALVHTERDRVYIATTEALLSLTQAELPELPSENLLAEPVARNTAPCIVWAAAKIAKRDPNAIIMVLPSDHYIVDELAFARVISRALASAAGSAITTVGIEPTRPETGYGYIETSVTTGASAQNGVLDAVRFVEKPGLKTAEGYLNAGNYLWNSGMFFFRAQDMLAAAAVHLPELWAGIERIQTAGADEAEVTRDVFERTRSVSIDYGIMEKLQQIHVVPGDFGWNDLGSWEAYFELADKDAAYNVGQADAVFVEAGGNLVRDFSSRPRTIALLHVSDLCVIQTDDAVLVVPRKHSQDVRKIVDLLQADHQGNKT